MRTFEGSLNTNFSFADREVPVLVVSACAGGAPPAVDVEGLARRLRGLVSVAFLASAKSTFEFANVMETHGYGREFKCFHGAVHLFGPTRDVKTDHRPLARRQLVGVHTDSQRTERLAGSDFGTPGPKDAARRVLHPRRRTRSQRETFAGGEVGQAAVFPPAAETFWRRSAGTYGRPRSSQSRASRGS